MVLIQAQIIRNPAAVVILAVVVLDRQIAVEHLLDKIVHLQGLYQLAHLMVLPLQPVKVVHRPHPHLIHSSDLLRKMVMMQLTDLLGPVRLTTPRDQPQDLVRQQVTQAQSDEASLTSQPHRLMVRRDLRQIMLMEVRLQDPS